MTGACGSTAELRRQFTADELDELQGIADAAGVSLRNIVAHNLAVFSDLGTASFHFAVAAARNTAGGLLHAASEGLPLQAALADCLVPVVHVRRPAIGIEHALLSFAGAAGGLAGINAHGLAITTCLPKNGPASVPRSCRRLHALVASLVLSRADNIDTAIALMRRHLQGGRFSATLSHGATDRLCHVEGDGQSIIVRDRVDLVFSGNHAGSSAPQSGRLADRGRADLEACFAALSALESPQQTCRRNGRVQ